jgi:protein tyrosine phosphatase (PTP) superfamily phosphohydrolase (DUF442 family)
MHDRDHASPRLVAGITNFGWVVPGLVARGEQPTLDAGTFEALREAGIGAVLSLRPDREPPPRVAGRWADEYLIAQERELAEAAGLRFANVPLQDFSAPPPDGVARALQILDAEVARAPGVYVHCRAGAGRAGVISGAWLIAHGGTGDRAAELYERFMNQLPQVRQLSPEDLRAMRRRVGQPYVWWALCEAADALGSPVSGAYDLLPAERPPEADTWPRTYREALRPWRERRE